MKHSIRRGLGSLRVAGLVWIALGSPGCGRPGIQDVCRQGCECIAEGPCTSDTFLDDCTSVLEQQQKAAYDIGCGEEFDDQIACVGAANACPTPSGLCAKEVEAYNQCLGQPQ